MTQYYEKYIKYKQKYVHLKKLCSQFGGETLDSLKKKIIYKRTHCTNPLDIFHQHAGECWNDSIQMLICFSDEIKSSVQQKLLNLSPQEIISLSVLESRSKFLAPIYRRSDSDSIQAMRAKKMELQLIKYLELLQNRLCLHLSHEKLHRKIPKCKSVIKKETVCELKKIYGEFLVSDADSDDPVVLYQKVFPLLDDKKKKELESIVFNEELEPDELIEIIKNYKPKRYKLQRRSSEISGIGSAVEGLKMVNKQTSSKHGATDKEMCVILNILSFSLLNKNNFLTTKITNLNSLSEEDITDSFAMIVTIPQHATCFYVCDSVPIYYNNNYGKIQLNWKNLLSNYISYQKTHTLILHWTRMGLVSFFKENGKENCIVLDYDGNVKFTDVSISMFEDWEKNAVYELIIIKKENSTEISDINSKLGEQFILADIYNCEVSNITSFDLLLSNTDFLNVILDKVDSRCDNFFNMFIHKLSSVMDLTTVYTSILNKFIKKVLDNRNYTEDDYLSAELLLNAGASIPKIEYFVSPYFALISKKITTEVDYKMIRLLAKFGQNINEFNSLYPPIENENAELFNFLLSLGADPNANNYFGRKIIFDLIIKYKSDSKIIDYINKLLEHGLNPNVKNNGYSVLEECCTSNCVELIKLLIKYKIDLNEKFSNNEYPVINWINKISFEDYYFEELKLLVKAGCNLNVQSLDGKNLIEVVIQKENIELLDFFIDNSIDTNALFLNGKNAIVNLLNSYTSFKEPALKSLIMNLKTEINSSILKELIDVKHTNSLNYVLARGFDINIPVGEEPNPLLYLFKHTFISVEDLSLVKTIIDSKVNVNQPDESGQIPIVIIISGLMIPVPIVKLLLEAGSDVTATDSAGVSVIALINKSYSYELKKMFKEFIEKK